MTVPEGRQTRLRSVAPPGLENALASIPAVPPPANIWTPLRASELGEIMTRLLALVVAISALLARTGAAPSAQQPQRQLTPEQQAQQEATRQDHQRMLERLKITSLRPGANPNNPQAPNAVNYDESKANPYPKLPDLRLEERQEGHFGQDVAPTTPPGDRRRF
jgi:hypothetical protein